MFVWQMMIYMQPVFQIEKYRESGLVKRNENG